jgi:hypothetical protein
MERIKLYTVAESGEPFSLHVIFPNRKHPFQEIALMKFKSALFFALLQVAV